MSVKTAAEALAEAVRVNINACYTHQEALIVRERCESPPWTETHFRRHAAEMRALAQVQTTHVGVIDALHAYDQAVQIERLAETTRELSEKANAMLTSLENKIVGGSNG